MSASSRGRVSGVILAGMALVAQTAPVHAANVIFNLPAHVIIEAQPHPGPGDPDRCIGFVFAEFPHIPKAVGYAATLVDAVDPRHDGTRTGAPPFPDDDHSWAPARWVAPSGFHRFALSGYSSGQGCADVIRQLEDRWSISKAKVSMSKKFSEQYKRPFFRCIAKRGHTYGDPVVIGKRSDDLLIVERKYGGMVTIQPEGTKHGQRINRDAWVRSPVIIETAGSEGSLAVAKISSVRGGEAILVGPGMRVRVEGGKPIEILKRTPGVSLDDLKELPDEVYKVRTASCVVAARG